MSEPPAGGKRTKPPGTRSGRTGLLHHRCAGPWPETIRALRAATGTYHTSERACPSGPTRTGLTYHIRLQRFGGWKPSRSHDGWVPGVSPTKGLLSIPARQVVSILRLPAAKGLGCYMNGVEAREIA